MRLRGFYIALGVIIGLFLLTVAFAEEATDDNVFSLGEVVVTGEKSAVSLATTVTEVSMDEIKAKGAETIADALKFLPGVSVQASGKGQVFVSIRGYEQNQVKVLIDGVPARENYFGTVDLSMLPADSISKITVTKGASSVLYGSNTMGGVINIITKKGGKPQTSVTASFGANNTANYYVNNGGQFGNLNYWLSGGYQTSDGFELSGDFDENDPDMGSGTSYNEDGGVRDLSDYTKKSLDAKIGYDPADGTSFYVSLNYVDSQRGVPTAASRYWTFAEWKQWHLNLAGEHAFTDTFKMKGRLFYVKHDDGLEDVSWDSSHTTKKKWFEKSYYDDASIGGELQSSLAIGRINTLRLGVNYMEDNHKGADYYDALTMGAKVLGWQEEQEYIATTYALALEDEIRPSDCLSFVLGVSYDSFEPTKTYNQPEPGQMDSVNPQAGIVYDLDDCTTLHASVGKKTRFPSLKELYSTLGGGNPDLEPEEAIAYEVGSTHSFCEMLSVDTALFYQDVENLISTTKVDGTSVYITVNEATLYGGEASLNAQLTSALDASLNYTYLATVNKAKNDRDLPGRPRHRLNLSTTYRFLFGLTANVQGTYVQRQYWENNSSVWTELPDYFVLNAKLTQKLKKVGNVDSEVFFQGSNVLDENYYETSGPEPGFNFLAGITLKM